MDGLRKTMFFLSLLLAVLFLDAARPQEAPSSARAGHPTLTHLLSVQLRDSAGQAPIGAQAAVTRETSAGFSQPIVLPLSSGSGSLRLDEGAYVLLVHAPGHERSVTRLSLKQDEALSLVLGPATPRTIEVNAEPNGELVPLANATVLLTRPGELPFGGKTNAQGIVRFDETPAGELSLTVYAPGYEPYRAVIAGDVLVRLRPVSVLRLIVEKEGAPAPGAAVWLSGLSLWPARAVQTGPKGYIDVTGLTAGRFTISAEQGDAVSADASLDLASVAGLTEVTLTLKPGRFVELEVEDPDGHPLSGVQVTHTLGGLGTRARHGETDPQGALRLGPIAHLEGQLLVRAAGYLPEVVEVSTVVPQVVVLRPSGRVAGRVLDERGMPVVGAVVEVLGTDINKMPVAVSEQLSSVGSAHFEWALSSQNVLLPAGELGVLLGPVPAIPFAEATLAGGVRLTTDERGHFLVADVPPGRLVVVARHPDYLDGKSPSFDLVPGGNHEVEVTVHSGQPLRGRVLDHRGFPVAQARVRVTAAGFERQLLAESDGSFSLGAAPPQVRLRVSRPEAPFSILLEVPVSGAQREQEVLLELAAPREAAEITTHGPDGTPVPLAQITVASLDPHVPLRVTRFTDRDGEAAFDQVVGLPVRLEVTAPGFVSKSEETNLTRETRIALQRAISVQGRVTAVRGRSPAPGATVVFSAPGFTRQGRTDELGHYLLADLPPGKGVFRAQHPELGQASLTTLVQPGVGGRPWAIPDIDLVAPLVLHGRVLDTAGRPVPGARLALDRLSAYLPLASAEADLGVSDSNGDFQISVDPSVARYLFAAQAAHRFGFSERLTSAQLEGRDEITVLLDRTDEAEPDVRATLLLSLEAHGSQLIIYAVARHSSAERAGLRREDRLLDIDGTPPGSVEEARRLLSGTPGSDVLVTYSRGGTARTVRILRESFSR